MNVQRANSISRQFSDIKGCKVEVWAHGLLVRYGGNTSYFTREECFWPFVFRIAGSTNANVLARIEAGLTSGMA